MTSAYALTASPQQIDDGSAAVLRITNNGPGIVEVSNASPWTGQLSSGGWVDVAPKGRAVRARALSSTATLSVEVTEPTEPVRGSDAWLRRQAVIFHEALRTWVTPDTNDGDGLPLEWEDPDSPWAPKLTGVYRVTAMSSTDPPVADGFALTFAGRTVTQPAVTRDGSGVVTHTPGMTVT